MSISHRSSSKVPSLKTNYFAMENILITILCLRKKNKPYNFPKIDVWSMFRFFFFFFFFFFRPFFFSSSSSSPKPSFHCFSSYHYKTMLFLFSKIKIQNISLLHLFFVNLRFIVDFLFRLFRHRPRHNTIIIFSLSLSVQVGL